MPTRQLRAVAVSLMAPGLSGLLIHAAGVVAASSNGSFSVKGRDVVVTMRGNGHGHGMSQYGARGAAIKGRSYRQIVAFYYPHTALTTVRGATIRVLLSHTGSTLTVASQSGLHVTGVSGTLPTAHISRYRLVAGSGTGTTLQRLAAKHGWATVRSSLPAQAAFSQAQGRPIRAFAPDGSSIAYDGALSAVRARHSGTAGGVHTVNRVSLDDYTAGVVPREMPASWQRAAVDAQAVAARSYGRYAIAHPRAAAYDICDTTMCQVYGGATAYYANGSLRWSGYPPAARDTAGQVLTYRGATIFAQFSASNGGWTVDGGQPYLVAKADPYDDRASGDPYLSYRSRVTASSIAGFYGLHTLSAVQVTKRDGHGTAGGRIVTATIVGRTSGGATKRIATTGAELGWAVGAGTSWLTFANG